MSSALTARGSTRQWRKIRALILTRDNHRCHWCGSHATTVDHIIPRHEGGGDTWENLVASCARDNYARGAKLATRRNPQVDGPFFSHHDEPDTPCPVRSSGMPPRTGRTTPATGALTQIRR